MQQLASQLKNPKKDQGKAAPRKDARQVCGGVRAAVAVLAHSRLCQAAGVGHADGARDDGCVQRAQEVRRQRSARIDAAVVVYKLLRGHLLLDLRAPAWVGTWTVCAMPVASGRFPGLRPRNCCTRPGYSPSPPPCAPWVRNPQSNTDVTRTLACCNASHRHAVCPGLQHRACLRMARVTGRACLGSST